MKKIFNKIYSIISFNIIFNRDSSSKNVELEEYENEKLEEYENENFPTISETKKEYNSFLKDEKDDDYNRNLFLYNFNFKNLTRVKQFIKTMNKIDNIEQFNIIEKKYSKYKLDFINVDMLDKIKTYFNFNIESNENFDDYLPNKAIDIFIKNCNLLKTDYLTFDLYRKYNILSESCICFDDDDNIENKKHYIDKCKGIDFLSKNDNTLYSNFYYSIHLKPIKVLYKDKKGMIVLEVEKYHYLVLCEWNDNDNDNNFDNDNIDTFKVFIKSMKNVN